MVEAMRSQGRWNMGDRMHADPTQSEGHYQAYLVRLWQDSPGMPWRALARDAETGEECRFSTVEHLFLFLHRRTEGAARVRESNDEDKHLSAPLGDRESQAAMEEI
jgi:hypothetical protein